MKEGRPDCHAVSLQRGGRSAVAGARERDDVGG